MLARQSFSHKKAQKALMIMKFFCAFVPFVAKNEQTKRDRPGGRSLLEKHDRLSLSGAEVFFGFSEHATAVQRIINDLAHCRSLWIDVHSVARFEVPDNALRSYLKSNAVELGITTSLDVVDSHKPLIQRQVRIKSHDCFYSSVLDLTLFQMYKL
jgi:hypothetical protein